MLSIILTAYNKAPFLRRALNALLEQNDVEESTYEVLAVNDGSTDESAIILDEYAKRDKRLRVLTQENQGLSMARNNGIEAVSGEYIWFVDDDDVVSQDAVSLFCKASEDFPDIIPIYAQTEGEERVRNAVNIECKTGKEVLLDGHWENCGVFNILKKAFLKDNCLRFINGIYHEDAEFTPRMLFAAKTVKVIPKVLYSVFRNPESITQIPRPKRAFDYLIVAENLSKFVDNNRENNTAIGKIIYNSAALCINNAMFIINQNNKETQRQFNIRFYEKREALLCVLRNSSIAKYKIEALLFELFPNRYSFIYRVLKYLN